MKKFRRSARRLLALAGSGAAAAAVSLHRRPAAAGGDPTVHMLVSSKTWRAGLLAAASFEFHTSRRWNFYIHEDGTVDKAAEEEILRRFSDAKFISREESDAMAEKALESYPNCLDQRSKHNLFLKFSDFTAFAPGTRFMVLDSDVIFFRRPEEILAWADAGARTCLYNEDTKEKFCIPRASIEKAMAAAPWPRFNSGLVLMPRAAMNLDLAEQFIGTFKTTVHHPQFFEQTLYGLVAGVWGRGGALPASYEISWGYFRKPGAICRHYVGEFKHDLLYIEAGPAMLASSLRRATFPKY